MKYPSPTASRADLTLATDYYPFGSAMPGRSFSEGEYRYGFQGQEKDDEVKGEGNSINYKYRMHDARIGRFFAVDPLAGKFPFYSTYSFSGNRVLDAAEFEGLEPVEVGKETPYLTIVILGRAGGANGDGTSSGKTLLKNVSPEEWQRDDGLKRLGNGKGGILVPPGEVVMYSGSDGGETFTDVTQTLMNYRDNNPNGKIIIVGHSLGAKDALISAIEFGKKYDGNSHVDGLLLLESTEARGMGESYGRNMPENVGFAINFESFNAKGYENAGAKRTNGSQRIANITLGSGTSHTNMDNVLTPVIGFMLWSYYKGIVPNDDLFKAFEEGVEYDTLEIPKTNSGGTTF
jgi:RHS repeat-associated protein